MLPIMLMKVNIVVASQGDDAALAGATTLVSRSLVDRSPCKFDQGVGAAAVGGSGALGSAGAAGRRVRVTGVPIGGIRSV